MAAGLVSGDKIHMDGSLVDANASKNSVIKSSPEMIEQLRRCHSDELNKLDELKERKTPAKRYYTPKNKGMMISTDPDCEMVQHGRGESRPRYKTHRAVDDRCGVTTAVETTAGGVAENDKLVPLVEQHEKHTQIAVKTVVADTQYGTNENFQHCGERGICSHMADMELKQGRKKSEIFDRSEFEYDTQTDTYRCPAGAILSRKKCKTTRSGYEYACGKRICMACSLRIACTRSKNGRSIKRHINQEVIDRAKAESSSQIAKKDRVRRKWLMEGSFADAANNHGLKRSRWRRLWRVKIQDCLIAAIQNIRRLLKNTLKRPAAAERLAVRAMLDGLCDGKWDPESPYGRYVPLF